MIYEIRARFVGKRNDGELVNRITWETKVENMKEALNKAAVYIALTEKEDDTVCEWVTVECQEAE